jgi:hypothetical protein
LLPLSFSSQLSSLYLPTIPSPLTRIRVIFVDEEATIHFFKFSENSLELEFSHSVGGIPGKLVTSLCAISEKKIAMGHRDHTIALWNVEGEHMEKILEIRNGETSFKLISLPNSCLCWKNGTTIFFLNFDKNSQSVRKTTTSQSF